MLSCTVWCACALVSLFRFAAATVAVIVERNDVTGTCDGAYRFTRTGSLFFARRPTQLLSAAGS